MDRQLIDYLPPHSAELAEIKALMATEQVEIKKLWAELQVLVDDQFIESAHEGGVSLREKMLQITPRATDLLDMRKYRLLARINSKLPYTMATLHTRLASLCGDKNYSITLDGFDLTVSVELTAREHLDEVKLLLANMCPANIAYQVELMYVTWAELSGRTWDELQTKNWDEVKNEKN